MMMTDETMAAPTFPVLNIDTLKMGNLTSRLATLKSRHAAAQGQRDLLKKQLAQKQASLSAAQANIALWQQVQILLSKASEFAREQLVVRLETTVTAALQAVFERDDIRFEIELRQLGGAPAANWLVTSVYGDSEKPDETKGDKPAKPLEVTTEPESARGGGYVDIVSLALRLALLELSRPRPAGPILLDEPAKMVSAEFLPNLAEFLKSYAAKTGRQIIAVTHHKTLAEVADVGYWVSQDGGSGISEVRRSGGGEDNE